MKNLYKNKAAFCLMKKRDRKRLEDARQSGKKILLLNISGNWMDRDNAFGFSSSSIYRLATPEAPTADTIDWSHVHPDYKWMARDKNGLAYLYKFEPKRDQWGWLAGVGGGFSAMGFATYKHCTCNWKDSLVQRPHSGGA